MEHQLAGDVAPGASTLVWPSTGNYGIGGSWVGPRMGYESVVILPEEMSAERFEKIAAYGARAIKTPGCESNVKEIYDECKRLAANPRVRIMNQFAEMANYRWHYHVTGAAAAEAVETLGAGRPAAFVSAMGSAGTIAAGDALKARFGTRIVGLEPVQCPTLSCNGYGGHAIEGIGDKHVTWIHHVTNLDAMMCIDDEECLLGLQLVSEPAGRDFLAAGGGLGRGRAPPLDAPRHQRGLQHPRSDQDRAVAAARKRRRRRDGGDGRPRPVPVRSQAPRRRARGRSRASGPRRFSRPSSAGRSSTGSPKGLARAASAGTT